MIRLLKSCATPPARRSDNLHLLCADELLLESLLGAYVDDETFDRLQPAVRSKHPGPVLADPSGAAVARDDAVAEPERQAPGERSLYLAPHHLAVVLVDERGV